jgi:hypothetical protein
LERVTTAPATLSATRGVTKTLRKAPKVLNQNECMFNNIRKAAALKMFHIVRKLSKLQE